MNIYLGEHFETFIRAQIATGRYANASEVVRNAMRLLEEREERLVDIRRGVDEGRARLLSRRALLTFPAQVEERVVDADRHADEQDDRRGRLEVPAEGVRDQRVDPE